MDFVTGLPRSNGNDAIWVVVDRLTKMRHLVPRGSILNGPALADLFLDNICNHHGLLLTIISDRGPQFAAKFWGTICHRLKIHHHYLLHSILKLTVKQNELTVLWNSTYGHM